MEINNNHPLVSVAVITYNSSQYVIETLESVRQQTYDNIELIISDDCSSDNTIELCTKWTEQHKARFSNIKIVQSPANTGQSGNYNRAFDACTGEWNKEIDGDDKLLPNCISDFLDYTIEHPEAQCIFGRVKCFGGTKELQDIYEQQRFRYDFFSLPSKDQLSRLILEGYCIPSPGYFYNRLFIQKLGIRNDERIPNIEDHPKWINLLKANVKFYYIDKDVAEYRLGSGISTQDQINPSSYKSVQLFNIYYKYPELIAMGNYEEVNHEADKLTETYRQKIAAEQVRHSYPYRIGRVIINPFKKIANLFH